MVEPIVTYAGKTLQFPQALCAEVDPELFFPLKGESAKPAKRICEKCVEKDACLEDALEKGDRFGVRGGKSERERRLLKKQMANG